MIRKLTEQEQEVLLQQNSAFNIFEGCCPHCIKEGYDSDIVLIRIGGTKEFLANYKVEDHVIINEWAFASDSVGMLQFHCDQGHSSEVYLRIHGDWATG